MLKKIADKLKTSGLTAWQIRETKKTSHQSFLAQKSRECQRTVETERCRVSLYVKRESDVMGSSSFTVVPSTLGALDQWIQDAKLASSLTKNQPFDLPSQPPTVPTVSIDDHTATPSVLKSWEDRFLTAVGKEKQIRPSAAEFFINHIETRLINSEGLDLKQKETLLHMEFVLLARQESQEKEFINRTTRRRLADFDVEKEVATSARWARDATQAVLPETGSFPVVFSEEPLDHLFNPILARASARLKYNRMLEIAVGQSILEQKAKGDTLTLWSNGLIPGAVGSYRFDSYGTPAQRVRIVENNTVQKLLADQRYGIYLNVPITGELGNMEIEGGSIPFEKLLQSQEGKPLYHIQAFSAFEPNAITGAFSAEIRSGYEISAQGIRPIKGGSVSGVLQKSLEEAWLSKEQVQRERILTPQGILFKSLDIAGREK